MPISGRCRAPSCAPSCNEAISISAHLPSRPREACKQKPFQSPRSSLRMAIAFLPFSMQVSMPDTRFLRRFSGQGREQQCEPLHYAEVVELVHGKVVGHEKELRVVALPLRKRDPRELL